MLSNSLTALSFISALAFLWHWWNKRGRLSDRRAQEIAILISVASLYAVAMRYSVQAPEERMHFVLGSVATFLFFRSFAKSGRWGWGALLGAWTLGSLAGGIEEGFQRLSPHRVFDWRDVGLNGLASFLAAAALGGSGLARARRDW